MDETRRKIRYHEESRREVRNMKIYRNMGILKRRTWGMEWGMVGLCGGTQGVCWEILCCI